MSTNKSKFKRIRQPMVFTIADLLNFAESYGGVAEFKDDKGQLWMLRKKVMKHGK